MKRFFAIALAATTLAVTAPLAGCGTVGPKLGLTQPEDEAAFAASALGVDHTIKNGQVTNQYAVAAICAFDTANYKSLVSGRNVADGVSSYKPADDAHAAVQSDGAKYAPDFCTPVTPPV